MAARNISLVRFYSTKKVPAVLWVKNNGNQPIKVPTKGCKNVDDFADKVRQKFSTKCQVALFTSLEQDPLDPGLALKDLLRVVLNNTSKTPLFSKVFPVVVDPVVTKTIYLRDTDEDGKLTDNYFECEIKDNENLRDIYKDGKGLVNLSEPKKIILDFNQIKDGEEYQVYKYFRYY